MRRFQCSCGNFVFFDNSKCVHCNKLLGFDPQRFAMVAVSADASGRPVDEHGTVLRHCRNRIEHEVCNWFTAQEEEYCLACAMNEVIPNLATPGNKLLWYRMEKAKRRLLYSLLTFGLPLYGDGRRKDLRFCFLEDKRRNPNVSREFVTTGHHDGVVTINIAEADIVQRHKMQQLMRERYRTLLGHFRHESGHYYFDYLVAAGDSEFEQLFGDPTADYAEATQRHYKQGAPPGWERAYISAYATAHPWEDWAETFAHYLHITETLETNEWVIQGKTTGDWIARWLEESVGINEICLSLGMTNPYPFVLSPPAIEKLRFLDRRIRAAPAVGSVAGGQGPRHL